MPKNTNPRAIKVVNEFIRPSCDRFVGLAAEAQVLAQMAAVQGTASVFPSNADVIDDGAETDGRPQVTNADALAAFQALLEFQTFLSTPSQKTGKTPLAAFSKMAVNPRI